MTNDEANRKLHHSGWTILFDFCPWCGKKLVEEAAYGGNLNVENLDEAACTLDGGVDGEKLEGSSGEGK